MKTNADDCAYPVIIDDVSTKQFSESGLTKREYFAAMAMQGLLSGVYSTKEMLNEFTKEKHSPGVLTARTYLSGNEAISSNAVSYADALIKKLNEGGEL